MAVTAEAAVRALGERKLLTDYLAEVTVPIFYDLDGEAEARGTGTLLDVSGRLLLITAAHVLEDRDITKFSSPWDRKAGLTSTWGSVGFLTPKSSDAWDVAIVELEYPDTIEAFRKNYRVLTLDRIAMPALGATHILAGYPAEGTTATADEINQIPFAYYTEMMEQHPADAEFPNPAWDLFFRLDRKGELFSGDVHDVPELQGASGCVIWELSEYDGPLWTPQKALRAVGVQRSAKPGHWFRASNWLAVVPQLAQFDRRAAAELAVTLLGEERAFELIRASGIDLPV
jgi:hypothetical protein